MLKNYKVIGLILSLMLAIPSIAQENEAQKKYIRPASEFLPVEGEFAFGISANPFIDFVGNMFNGTLNNKIGEIGGESLAQPNGAIIFPTVSIMGKYMLRDNVAIRANIGIIANRANDAAYVADDNAMDLTIAKVEDRVKALANGGSLALGLEYRVGKGRVQGVFSGSVLYAYSSVSREYSYGNAITEVNQKPTIYVNPSVTGDGYIEVSAALPSARVLEEFSNDNIHSTGLVGSVGVEWFFAPKISFGAEVNLSMIYTWMPSTYKELEGYNILTNNVETYTDLVAPKVSEFSLKTDNLGGNLSINFFF